MTGEDLSGAEEPGLCLADFTACTAECMDRNDFLAATQTSLADVCRLTNMQ